MSSILIISDCFQRGFFFFFSSESLEFFQILKNVVCSFDVWPMSTLCLLYGNALLILSHLTLSWGRLLLYRNQSIDLQSKSMDWFLYDNGLRQERVKIKSLCICILNKLAGFSMIETLVIAKWVSPAPLL